MPEQHEMTLVSRTGSGIETWVCPDCGRSVLMRWPPNFESKVIEVGDPSVQHRGVKGGAQLGPVSVDERRLILADEEEQWLRGIGIDWHGAA